MCKSAEQRKRESIEKLSKLNVRYTEYLPVIEDSKEVTLKDLDVICKKAISTLLIIQVAIDAANGQYDESKEFFAPMIERFGVEKYFNANELKVWNGHYEQQDLINVSWEYEVYWALVWALGLIDDAAFSVPDEVCDGGEAVKIVSSCKDYDDFRSKTKLRDIEDILDMLDLYYRYHWAVVDDRLNNRETIGIDPGVVTERRRGLEWLVSDVEDWEEVSLDT